MEKVIKAFRCFYRNSFESSRKAEVDKQLHILKKKKKNLPDIAQIFHLTVYFSISLQRTKTISLQKAHYLSSTYYLVFAPEEESLTKGQNKCSKILAMEFREFYIK